ncbi:hypothetical protein GH714_011929 [Hevea brasiliensis]|uniref:Protein DA1-like domain-containing protein n=1 Tax=Hevea brasiliensis TaxID=3981 RepID=A0A6A6N0L9_HEVBR|nr:hypothetical protein GH714_011929 [Hevea brasiliensis]
MESAIMDTGDCQPLYYAIGDYYKGINTKLDQQFPMLLIERQALDEAIVGEKNVICDLLLYHLGYCNLNPEVEEGIYQILSYMWLESEVLPYIGMPSTSVASSSSSSSKKRGKSVLKVNWVSFSCIKLPNDASPVYGGDFKAANATVNKYGLRRALDHIWFTRHFLL